MDKAFDSDSKDCGFESCQARHSLLKKGIECLFLFYIYPIAFYYFAVF